MRGRFLGRFPKPNNRFRLANIWIFHTIYHSYVAAALIFNKCWKQLICLPNFQTLNHYFIQNF